MSDTVKISWSGGKDSTAATLLHLEAGRDGCAICPNAKREEFLQWLNDWPGPMRF